MTTQSLRGMAGAGPMHWRGDRTGGNDPGGDPLDEDAAFKKFNPAFVGLLGRGASSPPAEMQAFTDFILTVRYPPNPIRRARQRRARRRRPPARPSSQHSAVDGGLTCNFCHALPLGTDGFSSFEGETQEFKIAHLRNAYQKVGMFGFAGRPATPAQRRPGARLRLPARRQRRDGLRLPQAVVFNFANDTHAGATSRRSSSPSTPASSRSSASRCRRRRRRSTTRPSSPAST